MKKIFLVLTLILILTGIPASAGATCIEISPVYGSINDQISVDILLSGNENMYAGSTYISYDTDLLEVVNITRGTSLNNCVSSANVSQARINWSNISVPRPDGVICTVTFNVISDKKAISNISLKNYTFSDLDGKNLSIDIKPGKVYLNGIFTETAFLNNNEEIKNITSSSVDVSTKIINATKTSVNSDVFIAKYDGNGALINVEKYNTPVGVNTKVSDIKNISLENTAEKVKVFYWNSDNSLTPLSEKSFIER